MALVMMTSFQRSKSHAVIGQIPHIPYVPFVSDRASLVACSVYHFMPPSHKRCSVCTWQAMSSSYHVVSCSDFTGFSSDYFQCKVGLFSTKLSITINGSLSRFYILN